MENHKLCFLTFKDNFFDDNQSVILVQENFSGRVVLTLILLQLKKTHTQSITELTQS